MHWLSMGFPLIFLGVLTNQAFRNRISAEFQGAESLKTSLFPNLG